MAYNHPFLIFSSGQSGQTPIFSVYFFCQLLSKIPARLRTLRIPDENGQRSGGKTATHPMVRKKQEKKQKKQGKTGEKQGHFPVWEKQGHFPV